MSSEKPADVFVRWIERIWSVYEVIGERIRLNVHQHGTKVAVASGTYNSGANAEIKVVMKDMMQPVAFDRYEGAGPAVESDRSSRIKEPRHRPTLD